MSYIKKHKWHLLSLILLLVIVGISWQFGFNTKNTGEITNSKLSRREVRDPDFTSGQIPNKDQNSNVQNQKTIEQPNPVKSADADHGASNKTQPQLPVIPTQGTGSRLHVGTSYKLQVTGTSTVYDAMQNSQLDFKTKTFSGLGEFVEEIGGLKNDKQEGKYWIYYINGETAKLGISTQIVVPGDLIEWTYGTTNL